MGAACPGSGSTSSPSQGRTILLSSHLVSDLERLSDHLVLLSRSRVRLAGPCERLLAEHHRLTGPRRSADDLPAGLEVVREEHGERTSSFVVRAAAPPSPEGWRVESLDLEELVLGRGLRGQIRHRRPARRPGPDGCARAARSLLGRTADRRRTRRRNTPVGLAAERRRDRWLAVKLLLVGVAAVGLSGLLDLLLTWAAGPYDTVRGDRFTPLVFGARGIVPPATAVFAFALGAAAGLLLRRPVAAMALTLAGCAAVQFAVPTLLRPDYLAPRTADIRLDATTLGHADGIVLNGSSLTIGGIALPDAWVVSTGRATDRAGRPPDSDRIAACLSPGRFGDSTGCLAGQNLQVRAVYQPGSRYWPFQWIEAALYSVLGAALIGLCFFWIRRRAA